MNRPPNNTPDTTINRFPSLHKALAILEAALSRIWDSAMKEPQSTEAQRWGKAVVQLLSVPDVDADTRKWAVRAACLRPVDTQAVRRAVTAWAERDAATREVLVEFLRPRTEYGGQTHDRVAADKQRRAIRYLMPLAASHSRVM